MKKTKLFKTAFYLYAVILASSCAKDAVQPSETTVVADKFTRIEKFISITSGTPLDEIHFDTSKQEFTIGNLTGIKMSKSEAERLYDISNNYKAKYEN